MEISFFEKYNIAHLDDQQKDAVVSDSRHMLLLAVPGSGKTTTLTARAAHMIDVRGIPSSGILVITFTKAAASDMEERFRAKYIGLSSPRFSTIHSFCYSVVKDDCRARGVQPPALITDPLRIIREIVPGYNMEPVHEEILRMITYSKNMMLTKEEIMKIRIEDITSFYDVFSLYEEAKFKNGLMDFDDMLLRAYSIFTDKDILSKWTSKYPYIFVDEAQDTSRIQHNIIHKMAKNSSLFMVGDEDQSIYGFRGADPSALLKFEEVYAGAKTLFLETNYRSTQEIVDKAAKFIDRNRKRTKKDLRAYSKEKGAKIEHMSFDGFKGQYGYIVDRYSKLKGGESMAVLYRNNSFSIPIIFTLMEQGIDFGLLNKKGLLEFFSQRHITDMLNLMKFAACPDSMDLFKKIYSKLGLYMSKAHIAKIEELYYRGDITKCIVGIADKHLSQLYFPDVVSVMINLSGAGRLAPQDAIEKILYGVGYGRWLRENKGDNAESCLHDIDMLKMIAGKYSTFQEFFSEIENLMGCEQKDKNGRLTMSTLHGAKGLEFDEVIITDMMEPYFPSSKTADIEEEVRLCYVGITRAKKRLSLLSYKEGGSPSEFISQIIKSNEDAPKHKKSAQRKKGRQKLSVGGNVRHKVFGNGTVVKQNEGTVTISFGKNNTRSFSTLHCETAGLIKMGWND